MTMVGQPLAEPLTVYLSNRQRTFRIRSQFLISTAETILCHAGQTTGELSVLLINDRAMRVLNAQYRGKDRPTDVLSFPQSSPQGCAEQLIGDVVISLQTATRQAQERQSTLHGEIVRLLVHGILHLLGYDHEHSPQELQLMEDKERMIIRCLIAEGITVSGPKSW
jgi:probable rRNA maturation factor|tara:strand:- start:389 stop:886 length:498 start_codon:yes stop_codon:yes gene_type:complete